MARWHKADCTRPEIVADTDTNILRSFSCKSFPILKDSIAEEEKIDEPWSQPSDSLVKEWGL